MTNELNTFLKGNLLREGASIRQFAQKLGIGYEHLKKSLEANRFSQEQLRALFPDETLEEIQRKFRFRIARAYRRRDEEKVVTISANSFQFLRKIGVSEEDIRFIAENKAVKEIVGLTITNECARDPKAPV